MSASAIPSLVEAKELVEKASKATEKTYQTLSFENNYKGWGCFPHVEFPGTETGKNADYFAIVATGDIYVPNEGDWTFACLNDDGVRFTISGNGLSDTFENDGLGGIFRAPWLRTVHFPRAGIYSVTCLFFENWGIAGLEFSAARGNHSRFDSSKFKLVGDPKSGIVMVGDAKDAGRQVQADHAFRRPGLLNSRLGRRSASEPREREQAGAAQGGALARLRERRVRIMQEQQAEAARRAAAANEEKAENERREAEAKAAAAEAAAEREQLRAEREQQRAALQQIQEELRRQREEKERQAGQAANTAAQQKQATVDGYTWSYRVNNGNAILTGKPCVSPKPEGVLVVPSIIDGHKVTKFDVHLSFVNCDKMTKIILPDGLESFGFGTFLQGCSSLADIEISKNNPNFTSFKGVLYSKDMKKVVAYPKARDKIELSPQTKIIGRTAFSSCTFIKEMIVPSGIERIESHTFGGMLNLEKIVFPASVNKICWQLFQGDSKLREIIFMGNAPEVHIEEIYGFFYDAPENIVIEVNKGTKGWNGKDSTDIPERWPKSPFGYRDSRPIRFIGEANANNNGSAGIKAVKTVAKGQKEKDLYMIVDLTKTGKRAVSYLDEAPRGGWSDEYRTKKIALRKIAPGSFEYLPGKSFKITKPFYIGVFEITQKQYEMVMKVNPSEFKGDMRPVEKVSYIDIRGKGKGLNWPKDNQVDADSYLGKLRKRIGIDFDLPTEVQWEYACRAGTKGDFNVDGVEIVKLGKCKENDGQKDKHVKVGSFLPNAWGLYDMLGNVWEWCLDRGPDGYVWMNRTADAKETDTDPKGPAAGSSRLHRGGSWYDSSFVFGCRSGRRPSIPAGGGNSLIGLRLACPVK